MFVRPKRGEHNCMVVSFFLSENMHSLSDCFFFFLGGYTHFYEETFSVFSGSTAAAVQRELEAFSKHKVVLRSREERVFKKTQGWRERSVNFECQEFYMDRLVREKENRFLPFNQRVQMWAVLAQLNWQVFLRFFFPPPDYKLKS